MSRLLFTLAAMLVSTGAVADHAHHHGESDEQPVQRPKVFLDKSPRIVAYQLKRLDNARLLLVETATDDAKYIPVFHAILLRPGMARKNRDEAVAGLTQIRGTDVTAELLEALETLSSDDSDQRRVGTQLSRMLVERPADELQQHVEQLTATVDSDSLILSSAGCAALIVAGHEQQIRQQVMSDDTSRQGWLAAVRLVPAGPQRDGLRDSVVRLMAPEETTDVRRAAITALPEIGTDQADSFQRLAPLAATDEFRTAAVRSLLRLPATHRDPTASSRLAGDLVRYAENTPAAQRTTIEFLDAMQLADELLARLPAAESTVLRDRLREVTVRVVRLRTVEEEMRYDRPFFAVEAGRPVQVVVDNEDLMPHNLVITAPEALKNVALAAAELGTTPGLNGKMYVPDSPDVLYSTSMVNAGQRERLTFTAPLEPGEYPYVCTFPRHWMRMYGVMVVVKDLDAWQRNPTTPRDPLGNNRSFVKSWKLDDFPPDELPGALRGRSPSIGARLFKEATCLSCHQMDEQGGRVGPALDDVLKRHQGDRHRVLREILEPSYHIDPKYAVRVIIDTNGQTTSGIVVAEDKSSVSVLVNPEAREPTVIEKADIEEMIPSTTSLMPKALLDKFTHDELMEILAYVTGATD